MKELWVGKSLILPTVGYSFSIASGQLSYSDGTYLKPDGSNYAEIRGDWSLKSGSTVADQGSAIYNIAYVWDTTHGNDDILILGEDGTVRFNTEKYGTTNITSGTCQVRGWFNGIGGGYSTVKYGANSPQSYRAKMKLFYLDYTKGYPNIQDDFIPAEGAKVPLYAISTRTATWTSGEESEEDFKAEAYNPRVFTGYVSRVEHNTGATGYGTVVTYTLTNSTYSALTVGAGLTAWAEDEYGEVYEDHAGQSFSLASGASTEIHLEATPQIGQDEIVDEWFEYTFTIKGTSYGMNEEGDVTTVYFYDQVGYENFNFTEYADWASISGVDVTFSANTSSTPRAVSIGAKDISGGTYAYYYAVQVSKSGSPISITSDKYEFTKEGGSTVLTIESSGGTWALKPNDNCVTLGGGQHYYIRSGSKVYVAMAVAENTTGNERWVRVIAACGPYRSEITIIQAG